MVTCWERADLLALVGDVYCIFVTSLILGQVWYLIVSFTDLCLLSYFAIIGFIGFARRPEECTAILWGYMSSFLHEPPTTAPTNFSMCK